MTCWESPLSNSGTTHCGRQNPCPANLFWLSIHSKFRFSFDGPLHQTFRVPNVFLAPPSSSVGQRLRQMECPRHFAGTFPILTARFPVPLECAPQRFPVLGSGFHHYFLDPLLE